MSNEQSSTLAGLSHGLSELVSLTAGSLVAVKSGAHRFTSGIRLSDKLIAVASHSLRREERVPVQGVDGVEAIAEVVGRDTGLDLAVLKAEGLRAGTLSRAEPALLKAGMLAVVVGLTVDAGPTASLGIVGAVGSSRRTWGGGTLDQFIRLDVQLYPSQSGAAVVNAEGQLLGMATPALSRHSTMVIPASNLDRIAQELAEQGRIRQGYLGIGAQPVTLPETFRGNLSQAAQTGLIILTVESGSPAEKAGLQVSDILLQLGDQPTNDLDALQSFLRGNVVGKVVQASLLRGGRQTTAEVTILERGHKS